MALVVTNCFDGHTNPWRIAGRCQQKKTRIRSSILKHVGKYTWLIRVVYTPGGSSEVSNADVPRRPFDRNVAESGASLVTCVVVVELIPSRPVELNISGRVVGADSLLAEVGGQQ